MPASSTGGRSGKRAISERLPPIASTVLRNVDSRRSLRFSSREMASWLRRRLPGVAQRQRGDGGVLQHVRRRRREREQEERRPEQADQQDREQQPVGDRKDHVDRQAGRRVDCPRIGVEPVERLTIPESLQHDSGIA